MRCTDKPSDVPSHLPLDVRRRQLGLAAGASALLAACSTPMPRDSAPAPAQRPGAGPAPSARPGVARARNWDEYRVLAARRLIEANPDGTFLGEVPEPLLAIPVLEIEVNADGSIRHISVQREPRQAKDTIQIAIDAVRRAAPFGEAGHLPRPWKFSEVFLFDDNRRFKPRTLDV